MPHRKNGSVTRQIRGQLVTLTRGVRYVATRPMLRASVKVAKITILLAGKTRAKDPVLQQDLPAMPRAEADRFLREFNNGRISLTGRVW